MDKWRTVMLVLILCVNVNAECEEEDWGQCQPAARSVFTKYISAEAAGPKSTLLGAENSRANVLDMLNTGFDLQSYCSAFYEDMPEDITITTEDAEECLKKKRQCFSLDSNEADSVFEDFEFDFKLCTPDCDEVKDEMARVADECGVSPLKDNQFVFTLLQRNQERDPSHECTTRDDVIECVQTHGGSCSLINDAVQSAMEQYGDQLDQSCGGGGAPLDCMLAAERCDTAASQNLANMMKYATESVSDIPVSYDGEPGDDTDYNRTPRKSRSADSEPNELLLTASDLFDYLNEHEEPPTLPDFDEVCRDWKSVDVSKFGDCMRAQPACEDQSLQINIMLQTLRALNTFCKPGCQHLMDNMEKVKTTCNAPILQNITQIAAMLETSRDTSTECRKLEVVLECVRTHIGACEFVSRVFEEILNEHASTLAKACPELGLIIFTGSATDAYAATTFTYIVPLLLLKQFLTDSWMSSTVMYIVSFFVLNLLRS